MGIRRRWALVPVSMLATLLERSTRSAQSPSLAGRTVNVIIGFGTGGGYDAWGRVLARHLGKHLPGNPTVIAQNMPGAGSFTAASHIYSVAPKDGTAIALISGDAALGPITGASGARFDSTRLTWIGTPMTDTNIVYVLNRPEMKVKSVNDIYHTEVIVGTTGTGIGAYSFPKALTALLGMKFKIISGFPSSANVLLAIERGELDGFFASVNSTIALRPDWISGKKSRSCSRGARQPAAQGCPLHCRSRQDRRTAPGDRISLRRPGAEQAVHRAARHAGRPGEDAARCLHGDHEGPRFHRRRHQAETPGRSQRRRVSGRADRQDLQDAEADHREKSPN